MKSTELVTGNLQAKFQVCTLIFAEILLQPETLIKMLTDSKTDRRTDIANL